jgi:very-short-patch-repair endonuclease
LAAGHITRTSGIPVTTPSKTIIDLRRVVSDQELRQAVRQVGVLGLAIGREVRPDQTRSELEFLFLELCRRNCLPEPDINVRIGSREVDFLWRDRGLIAETDGYRYHRGQAAFENDRARDLELRALGYDVIRLSYRQVVDSPDLVASVIEAALGRAPRSPRGAGRRFPAP